MLVNLKLKGLASLGTCKAYYISEVAGTSLDQILREIKQKFPVLTFMVCYITYTISPLYKKIFVKLTVKILSIFVAFSENVNFKQKKFVDNGQQCFALTPQANFSALNLNLH